MQLGAGDRTFDVDAVLFDKDGTLIALDPAWAPLAAAWIEAVAARDPTLATTLMEDLGFDGVRLVPDGMFASATVAALAEATTAILRAHAIPDVDRRIEKAVRLMQAGEAADVVPLGRVAETVAAMAKAGLKIGVVTNDDLTPTRAQIALLGIDHLVEVVITGDQGIPFKPAPDPVLTACRMLGVPPHRTLFVGDSAVDIGAGLAAGTGGTVAVGHPGTLAARMADAVVSSIDRITLGRGRG